MLSGKKILVGVTGSIAAYKSAFLVRLLIQLGAEVRVLMTRSACDFISPLTLSTLSKKPVAIEFVKDSEHGEWENHVALGSWADLFVIAPLSASSLSKIAAGQSDNLLIATYLSAKCPVWVAPAMDLDMFAHPATTKNIELLLKSGVRVLEPGRGELASGLEGKGRMEEPAVIATLIDAHFNKISPLKGKRILVTGGPTYEAIDPVRFIGNHSSGKTGVELALAAANRGARVTLITGPTTVSVAHPFIEVQKITSAQEMFDAVSKQWPGADIGIFSAAVADYKPVSVAAKKIKKSTDEITLDLVKNPDILQWAGETKKTGQLLVGFALESENAIENAGKKLVQKHLDMIVVNSLEDKGAGFGMDTNRISILRPGNNLTNFELQEKSKVAADILDQIEMEFQ